MPDASSVRQVACIGHAGSRKGVNHDGQVWLETCEGHLCSTQSDLFLDCYQCCQATGKRPPGEATQQVQEHYTTGAIIDAFASYARSCQRAQFGDDHYRVPYMHAECLHARRIINAQINV